MVSTERKVSGANDSRAATSQSFQTELADHLANAGKTAPLRTSLPPELPAGQKPVTRRQESDGSASSSPTGSTASSTSTPSGLNGLVIEFPSTPSTATPGTEASTETPVSFDDKYWASQPAAVQALRNMPNGAERVAAATELAQQGYTIDVPIMAWGWDPQITTTARESMGYTWVPSALQQPVNVQPGIAFGGQAYNAANPPPGSIRV